MPGPDPDIIDLILDPKSFGLVSVTRGQFAIRIAEVVSINDERKKGRIAVRVIGLHPVTNPDGSAVDETKLPWAQTSFGTAGNGYGDFCLPSVGDVGFVTFLHGDVRQPVWLGTLFKAPGGASQLPSEFQAQYNQAQTTPQVRGFITRAGHKFIVRDKSGDKDITIETPGGRKIVIRDDASSGGSEKQGVTVESNGYEIKLNEEDGEISVVAPGELKMNIVGNCVLTVGGDIKLGSAALTAALNGIVTKLHPCSFTGAPHPAASASVMAKP